MENIEYLVNNELVWDNKYFDLSFTISAAFENFEMLKSLWIKIVKGMNERSINVKFYYLGKNIASTFISILSHKDMSNGVIPLAIDCFLPFEEIEEADITFPIYFDGCVINTIYEYFIVTRGFINYDFDSCIPIMHKVDLNNTKIMKYYEIVENELLNKNITDLRATN